MDSQLCLRSFNCWRFILLADSLPDDLVVRVLEQLTMRDLYRLHPLFRMMCKTLQRLCPFSEDEFRDHLDHSVVKTYPVGQVTPYVYVACRPGHEDQLRLLLRVQSKVAIMRIRNKIIRSDLSYEMLSCPEERDVRRLPVRFVFQFFLEEHGGAHGDQPQELLKWLSNNRISS